jgi:hypothetical protein
MEITLDLIVFTVLAVFTLASAVLAVTTKRILRAATFLLFVLFGTAGSSTIRSWVPSSCLSMRAVSRFYTSFRSC